jgi:3-oxoacyl-[acyl-carrier protein] reductase
MGRLDGKVALISGTARSTGRAAAVEFAARGAAVSGLRLDEKASAATAGLVSVAGGRHRPRRPVNRRRRARLG